MVQCAYQPGNANALIAHFTSIYVRLSIIQVIHGRTMIDGTVDVYRVYLSIYLRDRVLY